MKLIDFREAKCMNCYKCVRYCDVKAINITDGKAEIMEERCVLCGHCLHVCPQTAKTMISSLDMVKNWIKYGEKIVISLAPAYVGFFLGADADELRTAAKKLGFVDLRETAEGAAVVTLEYEKLLQEGHMENIISTCCPSLNDMIEIYYPELIPYMAPVVSPMVAHGRMLKKEYGDKTKVVFVGPCIAKKKEAADPRHRGSIDAVLTFTEFRQWLDEAGIILCDCAPEKRAAMDPKVNRVYPVTSGVIQALLVEENTIPAEENKDHYRKFHIHGTKSCMDFLDSLKAKEITGSFIEMNMCQGACIQGSAPLEREISRFAVKIEMEDTADRSPVNREQFIEAFDGVSTGKVFKSFATNEKMPTEADIREILAKTGKKSPKDELNCGACGYDTCREKAIAVYQGKAEVEMCIPYLHDKAESMANLVLETSPNLIMIADANMQIIEFSKAGEKFFGVNRKEAMGTFVFEYLDDEDFRYVHSTHQPIHNKKINLTQYGITVVINISYVPEHDSVLAILTDVTDAEKMAKEEYEKKLKTASLAQDVIKRQMMVAQEIASLLGESTAETKITLLDLCDSLLGESEE